MDIVYYPDPVLQRRTAKIEQIGPDIRSLAMAMLETMEEAHGIGLAAPQVGQLLQIFVASDTAKPEEAIICINPVIEPFGAIVEFEEGCLSIPDIHADVARPESVRITYQNLDGEQVSEEYGELMARIIQHEFDHLSGVLFFDRMAEAERLSIQADLKTLAAQYRGPGQPRARRESQPHESQAHEPRSHEPQAREQKP